VAYRRTWTGVAVAGVGLTGLTAALASARDSLSVASVALLYLVPVVVAAVVGGMKIALGTAVAADLLVNFFFVPPVHTLTVERRENVITLVVYLLVAAVVAMAVDVAARHRADALRREAEVAGQAARARELAEIDRVRAALLAAVGHDLRTPLAAIKAAVSSLRQPDIEWPADAAAELLATVEESSDRLASLIDNLLSMSRLQVGALSVELTPVPLDAVVAAALLACPLGPSTVDIEIADDLPLVQADPGLLERVVANLVANAVAASPIGRPIRLCGTADGERVSLAVVDHGPGVPVADRDRMFIPFQRLNDRSAVGGLGLGLAIARGFTEAMHGTLLATATPGGGLTMTISLPVAR
jgi:two-component system sensor histidine kinase KdpD